MRSTDDENVVERNLLPRNYNSNFFIMGIATKMPVFGHRLQFVFLLDFLDFPDIYRFFRVFFSFRSVFFDIV